MPYRLDANKTIETWLEWDFTRAGEGVLEASDRTARIYGEDSGGARDPRTGVVGPRLKDGLKGRLQRLLEGWRGWNCAVPSEARGKALGG